MKPEGERESATTQVKVSSPEIFCRTKAKGFNFWKPEMICAIW